MSKSPNLYIIAGPNGAGKTTFARQFLPYDAKCAHFVNADLIAQGLSPFSPNAAIFQAGRILIKQIHGLAHQKEDFAFETTLSGKTYLSFLEDAKKVGYRIHLFFLWIPNVELALARIRARVSEGGHHVPNEDVRRRFGRSIPNFVRFYQPISDTWFLYDNSTASPQLIAKGEHGKLLIEDKELYRKIVENEGGGLNP